MDFFDIPQNVQLNKIIPTEKIDNLLVSENLAGDIRWVASIKPQISNVEKKNTETVRFEEIQIVEFELLNSESMFQVLREICKKIKYPLLMVIRYQDKYTIAACLFNAGKTDHSKNTSLKPVFSHWLRKDYMSLSAETMIGKINVALNSSDDLERIYRDIYHAICDYKLGGWNKSKTIRTIKYLGKRVSPEAIIKQCENYKWQQVDEEYRLGDSYVVKKRSNNYALIYDKEEVWYFLMKDSIARSILEGKRIRTPEELEFRSTDTPWY